MKNELRLGNWVYHKPSEWSHRNDDGVISNYGQLLEDCFQWDESDWYALGECTLTMDAIQPIPLTEELLLKCGFEKDKINNVFWISKNMDFHTNLCLQIQQSNRKDYFYFQSIYCKVKTLHHLQNIFFALFQTELQINL